MGTNRYLDILVGTNEIAEPRVTMSEGPVSEALRQNRLVFVSDLAGGVRDPC